MTIARRTEGPSAPLFFSAASIAIAIQLSSSPAWTQTVEISALELCAAMETAELKLSCFEAIIASSKAGTVEDTAATKSRAAAQPVTQATTTPAAAAAGVSAGAVAPKPAAIAPAAPVSADASASAAGESPAATVAPTSREDEFGQEHLVQPEQVKVRDDELLHATVVEVSKGRNDILYFHLDNGHIWRQNEARHYPYPKNSQFEVNITRGMMGDYRMRIGDNGRMVRIQRVK